MSSEPANVTLHERPPHFWTRAVLSGGTLGAGACLAVGLLLSLADPARVDASPHELDRLLAGLLEPTGWAWSMLGSLLLLATPAAGLIATAAELRRAQPLAALLALVVLAVLALALLIALA